MEDESGKTFTYDEEGQLIAYTENLNGEISEKEYRYSSTGNRLTVTTGADRNRIVSEYNGNGQLIKETDNNGTTEYTYDGDGNRTFQLSRRIKTYEDVKSELSDKSDAGTKENVDSETGSDNVRQRRMIQLLSFQT